MVEKGTSNSDEVKAMELKKRWAEASQMMLSEEKDKIAALYLSEVLQVPSEIAVLYFAGHARAENFVGRRLGGADTAYEPDLQGFWNKLVSDFPNLVKQDEVEWLVSCGLEMAADSLIGKIGEHPLPSLETPVLRKLAITSHSYR